ncbi:unnamed protein product, partial [Ectocarpus sp. 12 AP-2014]
SITHQKRINTLHIASDRVLCRWRAPHHHDLSHSTASKGEKSSDQLQRAFFGKCKQWRLVLPDRDAVKRHNEYCRTTADICVVDAGADGCRVAEEASDLLERALHNERDGNAVGGVQ